MTLSFFGNRQTAAPRPVHRRGVGNLWGKLAASFACLAAVLIALGMIFVAPADAQSATEIADELDSTGRYLEFSSDAGLDAAISEANGNGIAFAWLDQGGDGEAERLSEALLLDLDARGSRYRTVLVLMNDNFGAWSSAGDARTEDALNASLGSFADGAVGNGVSVFTSTMQTGTTNSSSESGDTGSNTGSSGGGLSLTTILLPLILLAGGFFAFRGWSNKRKTDRQITADLEADRAEIKEQLRSNADRVIELGDRVVLTDNRELQDLYEKASTTYQDVSSRIDGASSVAEVDDLDDRIDEAEWQLKSIEAQLDGEPIPPSPADLEAEEQERHKQAAEASRNQRPALGRDESVLGGSGNRPRTRSRSGGYSGGYAPRRRSSMGGGLGGMLGSIILGGMRGGRGYSPTRRTQRRTGLPGGFPSGGGLGGGVLRPGGGSRRSGGGRSIGGSRRGSGGGRGF